MERGSYQMAMNLWINSNCQATKCSFISFLSAKGTCNSYLHLRATGYMQLWGVTSGSHTGFLPSLGGLIVEVGCKKTALMHEQRGAQPAYGRGGWPDSQGSE